MQAWHQKHDKTRTLLPSSPRRYTLCKICVYLNHKAPPQGGVLCLAGMARILSISRATRECRFAFEPKAVGVLAHRRRGEKSSRKARIPCRLTMPRQKRHPCPLSSIFQVIRESPLQNHPRAAVAARGLLFMLLFTPRYPFLP